MGYQVGVTPLQMAAAVSSVANGGSLIEPRVVRAFIKDGRRAMVAREGAAQDDLAATLAELTTMMEGVVERGTAKSAQIDGYTIAGKTGTASKLVNGRYSRSDYNASFVGFVPSRQPALTIIVVIDSPHGRGYYRRRGCGARSSSASPRRRFGSWAWRRPSTRSPPVLLARRRRSPNRSFSVSSTTRRPRAAIRTGAARGRCRICAVRARARRFAAWPGSASSARLSGQGSWSSSRPQPGEPLVRGEVGVC